MDRIIKCPGQAGMSMVELLVSLACLGLILGGTFMLFGSQTKLVTSEEQMAEMQMNMRAAMTELGFIFSHAGYGCADSFGGGSTLSSTDPDTSSAITISSSLSNIVDDAPSGSTTQVNGTDSVVVTYGQLKPGWTSPGTLSSAGTFNPSLSNGETYCVFPIPDANNFYSYPTKPTVTSTKNVYIVAPVRIKVANVTRNGVQIPVLFAQNFQTTDQNYWQIADYVENLQIQYSTDGTTWSSSTSAPGSVKAVKFAILVRSNRIDPGYLNTKTYQLADKTVGPFNDRIHRESSEATIWLRNTP